jgi:hypothetical protein
LVQSTAEEYARDTVVAEPMYGSRMRSAGLENDDTHHFMSSLGGVRDQRLSAVFDTHASALKRSS